MLGLEYAAVGDEAVGNAARVLCEARPRGTDNGGDGECYDCGIGALGGEGKGCRVEFARQYSMKAHQVAIRYVLLVYKVERGLAITYVGGACTALYPPAWYAIQVCMPNLGSRLIPKYLCTVKS